MTGPEHYREAERLIEKAVHLSPAVDGADPELTALAQVHATLALAAATALGARGGGGNAIDGSDQRLIGMHTLDLTAWDDVAGVEGE